MISDLQPHPSYKDSGLPWLGQVPEHWEIKRGKSYLFAIDERSKTGKEELLTVSSARGVVPRRTANVTMFKAKSYVGYKLCWPDDLVINSLWAWGGGLGVAGQHGIISTAYSVYRIRPSAGINSRFLHELVRSSAFHWELQVRSKGVWISRLQLTDTAFLDAPIPLPPPSEQAAIVRFLDWANGRLERAIRAKKKIIALLSEQKQAIIHRAVTRGLDPNVPMKDSGIPWLGEIPAHWEVRRAKSIARIKTGGKDTANRVDDGTYPFFVRSQIVERINSYSFDGEAVLTAGDGAGVAKVFHYVNGRFDYHQRVYKFSDFQCVSGRFFFLYLRATLRFEALDASAKSTVDSLRLPLLQCFPCVIPPDYEQSAIVDFTEQETGEMDCTISRLEREIDLLREYRTRLVADVVTGKLDVREAAAQLPEEDALSDADRQDVVDTADDDDVEELLQ